MRGSATAPADALGRPGATALRARAVEVRGRLERRDGAVGVRAHSLREVAAPVAARSRDFR